MMPLSRGAVLVAALAALALIGGLYAAPRLIASGPSEIASAAAGGPADAQTLRGLAVGEIAKLRVHDAPRPVPPVAFLDPDGREISLDAFRGEVVFVNLWATWCAPCVKEMPSIDRLAQALEGSPFRVVAISLDRGGPGKPAAFLQEIAADRIALYRDPGFKLPRTLEAPGLPVTLILDRDGREIARMLGDAEWDAPEAKAFLRAVLGG